MRKPRDYFSPADGLDLKVDDPNSGNAQPSKGMPSLLRCGAGVGCSWKVEKLHMSCLAIYMERSPALFVLPESGEANEAKSLANYVRC